MSTYDEELDNLPDGVDISGVLMIITLGAGIALGLYKDLDLTSAAIMLASYVLLVFVCGFFEGALEIDDNTWPVILVELPIYGWFYYWAIYEESYTAGLGLLLVIVFTVSTITIVSKKMLKVIRRQE